MKYFWKTGTRTYISVWILQPVALKLILSLDFFCFHW